MAMRFPSWVDAHERDEDRATARLRYLISRAAVEATGKQSVRALADHIQMDHSSISLAIRRGYMTAAMAEAIEEAVGRGILRATYLTDPLKIKAVQ